MISIRSLIFVDCSSFIYFHLFVISWKKESAEFPSPKQLHPGVFQTQRATQKIRLRGQVLSFLSASQGIRNKYRTPFVGSSTCTMDYCGIERGPHSTESSLESSTTPPACSRSLLNCLASIDGGKLGNATPAACAAQLPSATWLACPMLWRECLSIFHAKPQGLHNFPWWHNIAFWVQSVRPHNKWQQAWQQILLSLGVGFCRDTMW